MLAIAPALASLAMLIFLAWIVACLGLMVFGTATVFAPTGRPSARVRTAGSLLGFAVLLLGLPCIAVAIWFAPMGLFGLVPFAPAGAALLRATRAADGSRACRSSARLAVLLTAVLAAFVIALLRTAPSQSPVSEPLGIAASLTGLLALVIGSWRVPGALRSRTEIDTAQTFLRWTLCASIPPLAAAWGIFGSFGGFGGARGGPLRVLAYSPITLPAAVTITAFGLGLALRARRMDLIEAEDDPATPS